MKVIVCGAGQVGFHIARQLASENNSVTVIDRSPELIEKISDNLDVQGLVGHASQPDVLARAGAGEADMLIAVTYADEVNMVACQVAHALFSVPTKVARVRAQSYLDPRWRTLFARDHLPIDVIISPEIEVARAVLRRLGAPGAFESISFANDRVRMIAMRIDADCPVVDTPLGQLVELFPDLSATVVAISRAGRTILPDEHDQILIGDDVYCVVERAQIGRLLSLFGHEEPQARRIVIIGGGNIGLYVSRELERQGSRVRAKVIERNKERAEFIADQFEHVVVLHGDGLDQEILDEANIGQAEVVVALTDEDEVNILASVLAKQAGCRRAITLFNNPNYLALIRSLGIDVPIDPRATTVSTILQHVRRGRIHALHSMPEIGGELIEAEALETSALVGRPLREADLPEGVLLGAVLRGDSVIMPRGSTEIRPGDHVILFVRADKVRKVEQMFRVGMAYF